MLTTLSVQGFLSLTSNVAGLINDLLSTVPMAESSIVFVVDDAGYFLASSNSTVTMYSISGALLHVSNTGFISGNQL